MYEGRVVRDPLGRRRVEGLRADPLVRRPVFMFYVYIYIYIERER